MWRTIAVVIMVAMNGVCGEIIVLSGRNITQAVRNASATNSSLLVAFLEANRQSRANEIIKENLRKADLLVRADPDFDHTFAILNSSADENEVLMRKTNLTVFPSLLVFGPLSKYEAMLHKGEYTAEAFASSVKRASMHQAMRLNGTQELVRRADSLMESFVLGVFPGHTALFRKFMNASKELPIVRFYYMLNVSAEKLGNQTNAVAIVHNPFLTENDTSSQLTFYDSETHGTLQEFIAHHFTQQVEICSFQTFTIYRALNLDYVVLFAKVYDDLWHTRELASDLKYVAKRYEGKLKMCLANIERGGLISVVMGSRIGDVVLFQNNGSIYQGHKIYRRGALDRRRLDLWIQQFYEGKLKPIDVKQRLADAARVKREVSAQKAPTQKLDL